jgi:hypothetical protein
MRFFWSKNFKQQDCDWLTVLPCTVYYMICDAQIVSWTLLHRLIQVTTYHGFSVHYCSLHGIRYARQSRLPSIDVATSRSRGIPCVHRHFLPGDGMGIIVGLHDLWDAHPSPNSLPRGGGRKKPFYENHYFVFFICSLYSVFAKKRRMHTLPFVL